MNGKIIGKIESASDHQKYRTSKLSESILFVIKDYFYIKKVLHELKSEMKKMNLSSTRMKEIMKLSKDKLVLSRRIGLLRTMQSLFRYWHIAHLPFAITMFVIMLVHVAVTIVFGYKWIF